MMARSAATMRSMTHNEMLLLNVLQQSIGSIMKNGKFTGVTFGLTGDL